MVILGQVPAQSAHCDLFKTHGNNLINTLYYDCFASHIKAQTYHYLRVSKFLICLMHLLNCGIDHVLPAGTLIL